MFKSIYPHFSFLLTSKILNNPNIDFDSSTLLSEAIIGAFAGGFGAFLTNPTGKSEQHGYTVIMQIELISKLKLFFTFVFFRCHYNSYYHPKNRFI